jgi:hypothetical protein
MKNQNIQRKKMWWYFTFSTGPGEDWEWAPKSKNSQKEVTSPQDKELFKLQGSFQKKHKVPETWILSGRFLPVQNRNLKKSSFCFDCYVMMMLMEQKIPISKSTHFFFPGPRWLILVYYLISFLLCFSYGKRLYLGLGFGHKILAKTWGFSYGRDYALV